MSTKSVMLSKHLILCHPLLLLPSIFPSMRLFANELTLHIRWPKYWSFSFNPSDEYSFRVDFLKDWLITTMQTINIISCKPPPVCLSTNLLLKKLKYKSTLELFPLSKEDSVCDALLYPRSINSGSIKRIYEPSISIFKGLQIVPGYSQLCISTIEQ